MPAHKGHKKAGGRQKGTPNKSTGAIRDLVRQALEQAGGASYLAMQAELNPGPFLALVGRLIPAEASKALTATATNADGKTTIEVRYVEEPVPDADD